jgi:hypothetical protein
LRRSDDVDGEKGKIAPKRVELALGLSKQKRDPIGAIIAGKFGGNVFGNFGACPAVRRI